MLYTGITWFNSKTEFFLGEIKASAWQCTLPVRNLMATKTAEFCPALASIAQNYMMLPMQTQSSVRLAHTNVSMEVLSMMQWCQPPSSLPLCKICHHIQMIFPPKCKPEIPQLTSASFWSTETPFLLLFLSQPLHGISVTAFQTGSELCLEQFHPHRLPEMPAL